MRNNLYFVINGERTLGQFKNHETAKEFAEKYLDYNPNAIVEIINELHLYRLGEK